MGLKVRPMFIIKEIPNLFFSHTCRHMVNLAPAAELPAVHCLCSCSSVSVRALPMQDPLVPHLLLLEPFSPMPLLSGRVRGTATGMSSRRPSCSLAWECPSVLKVGTRDDTPAPSPSHEWMELVKTGTGRCFMQDSFPVWEMNEEVTALPWIVGCFCMAFLLLVGAPKLLAVRRWLCCNVGIGDGGNGSMLNFFNSLRPGLNLEVWSYDGMYVRSPLTMPAEPQGWWFLHTTDALIIHKHWSVNISNSKHQLSPCL